MSLTSYYPVVRLGLVSYNEISKSAFPLSGKLHCTRHVFEQLLEFRRDLPSSEKGSIWIFINHLLEFFEVFE